MIGNVIKTTQYKDQFRNFFYLLTLVVFIKISYHFNRFIIVGELPNIYRFDTKNDEHLDHLLTFIVYSKEKQKYIQILRAKIPEKCVCTTRTYIWRKKNIFLNGLIYRLAKNRQWFSKELAFQLPSKGDGKSE